MIFHELKDFDMRITILLLLVLIFNFLNLGILTIFELRIVTHEKSVYFSFKEIDFLYISKNIFY